MCLTFSAFLKAHQRAGQKSLEVLVTSPQVDPRRAYCPQSQGPWGDSRPSSWAQSRYELSLNPAFAGERAAEWTSGRVINPGRNEAWLKMLGFEWNNIWPRR